MTGAASGIGAATVAGLEASGWQVIGIDKDKGRGRGTATGTGARPVVVADLGSSEERRRVVDEVAERSGGTLHGVVTCAGLAWHPDRAGSILAHVNYFGTVDVLEGLRPLLTPGSAAVAISSNSTTVQPGIPAELVEACLAHDEERAARIADEQGSLTTYPATKMAVAHWVRKAATGPDWAGAGIRLNAIAPGMIDTPMVAAMRADAETAVGLELLPIPLGRPGRPEEIAALVEFLLGPDSSFFCGSVVFCDGGSDAVLRTRDWPAAWGISVRALGKQLSD